MKVRGVSIDIYDSVAHITPNGVNISYTFD